MKIVLLEDLGVAPEKVEKEKEKLEGMGHTLEVFAKSTDPDVLKEEIKDADAIILANMPLPEDVVASDPNLKLIDVAFTGVDHVPVAYAKDKGIAVSNASGYANEAVAELVLAMMIDRLRYVDELSERVKDGQNKGTIRGSLLKGKKVGIIGVGAIGREVARLCKAFGADVIGFQRRPILTEFVDEQTDLGRLLKESDLVTIHTPLTEQTKHMIGKEQLAMMKPSAILINTARGPVVDEDALAKALNADQLGGAAVDVYDKEPPLEKDLPILSAKHVTVTPHVGYDTVESMEKRFDIVFDNLYSWLDGNQKNTIC